MTILGAHPRRRAAERHLGTPRPRHATTLYARQGAPRHRGRRLLVDVAILPRRREDGFRLAAILAEVNDAAPVFWCPTMVGNGTHRSTAPSHQRRHGDWPKVAFSPRKAGHSLHGLKDRHAGAALLPRLGTCTEGAGCVYVKKLNGVDLDVLRELIAIAWARGDDPVPNAAT